MSATSRSAVDVVAMALCNFDQRRSGWPESETLEEVVGAGHYFAAAEAAVAALEGRFWVGSKDAAGEKSFRVHYARSPEDGPTGSHNYVDVRASSPQEAVERRLGMLGGHGACAKGSGFVCDGEWFPVQWKRGRWVLAEREPA